jgi:GH15 family glucan-1,4-alpha-glucosidase
MPHRIENYALIGDCETAALVERGGSIDWLCWPRFDSDACFAALLGKPDNGRWLIAPRDMTSVEISRRYQGETLILETTFETPDGAVKLIDFMPPRHGTSDIVRLVIGERGSVVMRTELEIRFGYGTTVPWVQSIDKNTLQAVAGPDLVALRTPVALHGEQMSTVGDFTVSAGETHPFVLTYQPSHEPLRAALDPIAALHDTEAYWTDWANKAKSAGPWSSAVTRSLITLKALTYAPTGGIVAAPTTSLPEHIGGARNWDYRFCWVRDATLTLLALMNSGYYDEAGAWRDWLMRAVAGSPDKLQIMYGIAGERRLTEWEVPWLAGYENSLPVRIGNAAHGQLQLDVYGELMDALYQARRGGLEYLEADWALQCEILRHLETIWHQPDEGIWEVRGGRRHFTYSKVMAWTAFDRGIKSIEEFGLPGPLERWRETRQIIHEEVCRRGYDAERGTFVQSFESHLLDASLLLLPAVGFLPPEDPRIRGTIEHIERELVVDGYVLRYKTDETQDGLPPGEGAFLACSFWLADAYVMLGRMDDARALFERLVGLCNDLGLLAEEYDPIAKRMLGNFPQAFSHVALINTAHNLSRVSKPVDQRADRGATPGEKPLERAAD